MPWVTKNISEGFSSKCIFTDLSLWAGSVIESRCPLCFLLIYISPPHVIYLVESHWPCDHMISVRPLIGQPPPFPQDIVFCKLINIFLSLLNKAINKIFAQQTKSVYYWKARVRILPPKFQLLELILVSKNCMFVSCQWDYSKKIFVCTQLFFFKPV